MTNNKTKGFLLGAIAAASYGMNPLFTLPLYSAGMSVDSVLFYRYALAIVVLGIMMKMQKQSFAIKKADVLPLCIMGLLFSFSSLFLFMSYNYMDAGIASTILFVYPVLVAIIMAVVFKEKVSPVTMFSIALAFVGISLLCKSPGGQTLSLVGITFVFLSSLSYAIYIVGVNRSSLKDMPIAKLTFYVLTNRLLHSFRNNAGVFAGREGGYMTVKKLGGWESLDCELRGHTTGHLLSAYALMYASTGSEIFKLKGDSLVTGLAEVQAALGKIYL